MLLGSEVVLELDSPIYDARVVAVSVQCVKVSEVARREVKAEDSLCSELTSYTGIGDARLLVVGFSSQSLPKEVHRRRVASLSFGFESFCSAKAGSARGGSQGQTQGAHPCS